MDGLDHASRAYDMTYSSELVYCVDYLKLEEEQADETRKLEDVLDKLKERRGPLKVKQPSDTRINTDSTDGGGKNKDQNR